MRIFAAAFLGALVAASAAAFLTKSAPHSVLQTIYVRNLSTYVGDREVARDVPAFAAAIHNDFAPLWNVDANLVFIGHDSAPVGSSTITLVDKGPVKGALAYHELTDGVADAIVYTGVSKYYGFSWTVGLTHELWEMLADVPAGAGAVDTMQDAFGTIWAKEIADPVESDADAYVRRANGHDVLISDFVTEKWFCALTLGPYDFANHVQAPLFIRPGGYAQWWNGAGWNVINHFHGARDRLFLNGEDDSEAIPTLAPALSGTNPKRGRG